MNLKEEAHTAQMYANIAAEIYEDDDIKSIMENAESVSIKVGNERPVSFTSKELFEISRLSDDEFAKIAKSE